MRRLVAETEAFAGLNQTSLDAKSWQNLAPNLNFNHFGVRCDQTIFNLNFASFLHIFYIDKYQEFAYFDIFLVFVQKKWKNVNSGLI